MVRRAFNSHRRGGVYLAVLGVAMIVGMIGVISLHIMRLDTRSLAAIESTGRAQLAAMGAAEVVVAQLQANSSWRSSYTHNVEVPAGSWTSLDGSSSYKFVLTDADGNLNDDANDMVTLRVIAQNAGSTAAVSVDLEPGGAALDCLDVNALANTKFKVNSGTTTTNQTVAGNDNVEVGSGASVAGDAWSFKSISGTVTGTATPNATPKRTLPDTADVFKYYIANATPITIGSIPSATITRVVLSSTNNPYGVRNAQGLYYIDSGGTQLKISDCRIQATLIVKSSQPVLIERAVNWVPPAPNYPMLMMDGQIQINAESALALSELLTLTNFNPSHTPYQGGSDIDALDTYPSELQGLIYAKDHIAIGKTCDIKGVVIGNAEIRVNSSVNLTYSGTPRDYPPPGFSGSGGLQVLPGSWRRSAR